MLKHWKNINEVMAEWGKLAQQLEDLKTLEAAYRMAVYEIQFPECEEGTNRLELGNGYSLKCVAKLNYTLANKNGETEAALDELEKTGEQGKFLADRLVKWSPDLSVKEYRDLDPKYKTIIDKVLTIKPGTPQMEIEEPKAAKI